MQNAEDNERWTVLLISCSILWCLSFSYDVPSVLHDSLMEYSGLSEAYSLPNLILPLLFGYYADFKSANVLIVSLAIMGCLGQGLLACGILLRVHWLSISSRFLFGVGCESLSVALSSVLTRYFKGKELAFALALSVSSARLGTITNDWISPWLSKIYGTVFPFWIGFALTIVGVCCAFLLTTRIKGDAAVTSVEQTVYRLSLGSAIKSLSSNFWIAGIVCATGYAAILPFISVFIAVRPKELTQESAGQLISVVFLVSAVLAPIIGRVIDRFGRAAWVLCISCFLICLSHSMFMTIDHILVVTTLGVAYAGFVASVWPMVPLTVDKTHVGLGYGLLTSLQNAALVLLPLITAWIKEESGSYSNSRWAFLSSAILALLGSAWLAVETDLLAEIPVEKIEEEAVPLTTG